MNSPEQIVDLILANGSYRERARKLGRLGESLDRNLAEALCLRSRSVVRSDPREAYTLARLAIRTARHVRNPEREREALRIAAQAGTVSGDYRSALRHLAAAVKLADGDRSATATLDAQRVQVLTHLEDYEEARAAALSALAWFAEAGDLTGEIRTRLALGDLEFRLDRPRAALAQYSRLDRLLPPDASNRVRGVIAGNRANSLGAVNRFHAASRHFEAAKAIFVEEGAAHTVAQVEYNAAYADFLRGRYERALRRYSGLAEEFERFGDERHLAHTALDRAEIHLQMNMPDEALSLAREAETRFEGLGLAKEQAQAAQLTGRAAELTGDSDRAAVACGRAGELFDRLGLDERRVGCLVQQARLDCAAGRSQAAFAGLAAARTLVTKTTNPLVRVSVILLDADLELMEGRHDTAAARGNDALALCRRVHAPWITMEAFRVIGRAASLGGKYQEAVRAYRAAIEILEEYRGGIPPDEYMSAFLGGRSDLYEEIVALLVRMGEDRAAFEFAERAKSRALVDLLSGDRGEREDGTRLDAPRLSALRERLNAVYRRIFRRRGDRDERSVRAVMEAQRDARDLEDELARTLRETRLSDPERASLLAVRAPDLAAVRESLEPGVTLIEYFATRTNLFTFVVTQDRLEVVRQEVGSAELRKMLVRFHFHLSRHQAPPLVRNGLLMDATRANLTKLSDVLIGPLAERLTGTRLVIGPHGVLHHVPFHALRLDDAWLSERFEVVITPSAGVYEFCGRRESRADGPAAVFGLPDDVAPRIEDETLRVAEVLESDHVYLREDAGLSALREEACKARILHIATHGMFRHHQPMLSSIRMADGWMNLYDLYDLDVRGEMVVLSTCESGTADVTDGDEILGLTRGFLYAGAPALLTSQWRVDDAVTSEFMDSFYRHLREEGDAAAAHRLAMADVRRNHPHPYYWAPFFLTGRPVSRTGHEEEVPVKQERTAK